MFRQCLSHVFSGFWTLHNQWQRRLPATNSISFTTTMGKEHSLPIEPGDVYGLDWPDLNPIP